MSFSRDYWVKLRTVDAERGEHGPSRNLAVIARLVSQHGVHTLLDIGCGDGQLFTFLDHSTLTYIGLDRSRGGFPTGTSVGDSVFVQGDGCKLPVRDEGVDAVVVNQALHHVGWGLLTEAHRVLRPGGLLVIVDHTVGDSVLARLSYQAARLVPRDLRARPPLSALYVDGDVPDTLIYTKNELKERLIRNGFTVIFQDLSGTGLGLIPRSILLVLATRFRGIRLGYTSIDTVLDNWERRFLRGRWSSAAIYYVLGATRIDVPYPHSQMF